MKNIIVVSLFVVLAGSSALGAKITGACQLEGSQQNISLTNLDPTTHFGLIAEGFSVFKDRVFLTVNVQNSVVIEIQSLDGGAYGIFPVGTDGKAVVKAGALLVPSKDSKRPKPEWLSCDLVVAPN